MKKHILQASPSNWSSLDENYSHSYWRILLIIASISSFAVLIVYNQTNNHDINNLLGFKDNQSEWFYYILYSLYVWQALWLIYGSTTIIRKSSDDYFYKYPPVMHWIVYANFLISNLLNLCGSLLINNRIYILSTFYYFLIFIAIFISLTLSILQLNDYQREMYYTEKHMDIWLIRILVQNGLLFYASWAFIFLLVNLNITLVYEFNVSTQVSSLIMLAALNMKAVLSFVLENCLFYKYLKFLFTSWLLSIVFLIIFIIQFKHSLSSYYDLTFMSSLLTLFNFMTLFIIKVIIFLRKEIFSKNIHNNSM